MHLIKLALDGGYTVEEVDAIFGAPMGRPKSAVFRTADLVGLDTVVARRQQLLRDAAPTTRSATSSRCPRCSTQMVEKKLLGDKTGGGFFKKTHRGHRHARLSRRCEYRPQQKAKFASVGATKGVGRRPASASARCSSGDDRGGRARAQGHLRDAGLRGAPHRRDRRRRRQHRPRHALGLRLGARPVRDLGRARRRRSALAEMDDARHPRRRRGSTEMVKAGRASFYERRHLLGRASARRQSRARPRRASCQLPALRKKGGVVFENDGATLCDLGDGVACLELHTKMNAIDADVIAMIHQSVDEAEKQLRRPGGRQPATRRVLASAPTSSSWSWRRSRATGRRSRTWPQQLQDGLQRLKYAPVPAVTAPFGLTLGGGAEIAMHGAAARAHAEIYMGLVEVGVGLIPGGGGCKELLARASTICPTTPIRSRSSSRIFMNDRARQGRDVGRGGARDGLLVADATASRSTATACSHDAKQTALGLARAGYRPPRRRAFRLPGESGYATLRSTLQMMHEAHQISEHDVVVGSQAGEGALRRPAPSPTVRSPSSTCSTSSARPSSRCAASRRPRSACSTC